MTDKEITYSEAIAQIEAILRKFNDEKFDVDTLAAEVKRATELIAVCRQRLTKAESDVAKVLETKE